MNKTKLSILITLTVVCGCSALLFALALPVLFITGDGEAIGGYGSFIGGLLGSVLSFVTVILVYQTYRLQEQELKETREQLKNQQFESTFYNMLNMINTIGSQLSITIDHGYSIPTLHMLNKDIQVHQGNNFCLEFINDMKKNYNIIKSVNSLEVNAVNFLIRKIHTYHPDNTQFQYDENGYLLDGQTIFPYPECVQKIKNWSDENEEVFIGFLYEYFFAKYEYQLGHFFRYLSNTIDFAIAKRDTDEERKFYINLIQAQLSNYQLAVMFYNALSPVSLNDKGKAKFRQLIDDYKLLKNLPKSMLIKPEHADYYETKLKNA